MNETLIANLAKLAVYTAESTDTDEFVQEFTEAIENAVEEGVDFDSAVDAAFGIAKEVAAKTPSGKDDKWIEAAEDLYKAIKDPETGLIEDLVTFIRNRRATKKA